MKAQESAAAQQPGGGAEAGAVSDGKRGQVHGEKALRGARAGTMKDGRGRVKKPDQQEEGREVPALQDTPTRFMPPRAAAAYENAQLNLFQRFLANTDSQRESLSNAIDLWDSVPRYSISRQAMTKARVNGEFLRKHELTFQHRGITYTRIVSPARITDAEGRERDFYPSASEELVEDALRKIATEQHAGYFDRQNFTSGVMFTLHALRQELAKRGHTRSYYEIVESLTILSQSIIEIVPHGAGQAKIVGPCLPTLAAVSRDQLRSDPDAKWIVSFHPLVTGSIDQVTYRQYNYELMMKHTTQLARWLHKQLVLKFTFAELMRTFEMRYSTIKRDSGLLDEYARERDAMDKLDAAFAELKEHGVILNYERKDVTGPRGKKLEIVFTVHPHYDFVREAKAANRRQNDSEKAVGLGRGLSPSGRPMGRGSSEFPVGLGRGSR